MTGFKIATGVLMLLLVTGNLAAQSLDRYVVASTGNSASGSNISVDYTIGELVVLTVGNSNYTLTQGFHQPSSGSVSIEDVSAYTFKVFPNPFTDFVQVELSVEQTSSVQIKLNDIYGRAVYENGLSVVEVGNHVLTVPTQQFAVGTYILSLSVKKSNGKLITTSSRQINLIR